MDYTNAEIFWGEIIGTGILVLLGDGVVANVPLARRSGVEIDIGPSERRRLAQPSTGVRQEEHQGIDARLQLTSRLDERLQLLGVEHLVSLNRLDA